jgi:transposase
MFLKIPTNSGPVETNLSEMRIDDLRDAIRQNRVTFPSQVPTFPKHDRPDLQRKMAQLYFASGWSCPKIGVRYGFPRVRVQQILNAWKRRAVELGYIQTIPHVELLTLPLEFPPIQIVLTPVLGSLSTPVGQPSAPALSGSPPSINTAVPNRANPQINQPPRLRFDTSQIVTVLEQLGAGRTVTEMAKEVGVSRYTIRTWKQRHELNLLRLENARLKERLARLEHDRNNTGRSHYKKPSDRREAPPLVDYHR